jgi:thymidylate synthase (FAD)
MPNLIEGGKPNVVLLAGGGRLYTDLVARFCASEKSLDELVHEDYNPQIVKNILSRGHLAAIEFDFFIFGVEGVSRVSETQLVRKRLASYMIKSGRIEKDGKRSFDVIKPPSYEGIKVPIEIDCSKFVDLDILGVVDLTISYDDLMDILEQFYNGSVEQGVPEQDARFSKPQATETKCAIGMNAHALIDWFKIRCCNKAQWEIRAMANEMLRICKEVSHDLFWSSGASCDVLGYCPENENQCLQCKGKIPTHRDLIQTYVKSKFALQANKEGEFVNEI